MGIQVEAKQIEETVLPRPQETETTPTTQQFLGGSNPVIEMANPFFQTDPTPLRQKMIRNQGTGQQRQWLLEWEAAKETDSAKEYRAKLAKGPKADRVKPIEEISAEMLRQMTKGAVCRSGDQKEAYRQARILLYDAYRQVVFLRSSAEPEIVKGDQVSRALTKIAHWLVGLDEWQLDTPGECLDPRKSLYFCGEPGNGKSSIALAAQKASLKLSHYFNTGLKLDYRSMNAVVSDIVTSNNLAPLKALSRGGLVIDELRSEHLNIQHYGNHIDVIADTLLNRYEAWHYSGFQTIITSNMTPAQLVAELGDDSGRITDRIRDQYTLVRFTGKSFRERKMKEVIL